MFSSIFNLTTLWWVMMVLYIPACIGLMVIVLLQKGKGVGFGGAFGMGGGSDAIFGPRTSRSLPQQLTYAMGATFMVLALLMSIISGKVNKGAAPTLQGGTPQLTAGEGTEEPTDRIQMLLNPDAPIPVDEPETEGEVSNELNISPLIVSPAEPAPAGDVMQLDETVDVITIAPAEAPEAAPAAEESAPVEEEPAAVVEESAPAAEEPVADEAAAEPLQ